MICYHEFLIDLPRYAALGKKNDFPDIDCCPICRAKNRLQRHGFYERHALEEGAGYRIPICRLRCPDCGKTVSLLPTFLLPYFQHTMAFIVRILLTFWITSTLLCNRQLRRFYEKRAEGKQTEMELFFREEGVQTVLPNAGKEKAIKLLQMIQALGKHLRQKVVASSSNQLYGSIIIPRCTRRENRITFPQTFFLASLLAVRLYGQERLAG